MWLNQRAGHNMHLMEIFPRLLENENTRKGTLDQKAMHFCLLLTSISF